MSTTTDGNYDKKALCAGEMKIRVVVNNGMTLQAAYIDSTQDGSDLGFLLLDERTRETRKIKEDFCSDGKSYNKR